MPEALGLARRICANSGESVAAFLELARIFERQGPGAAQRLENELFGQGWVGERFKQRVAEWTERSNKRIDD